MTAGTGPGTYGRRAGLGCPCGRDSTRTHVTRREVDVLLLVAADCSDATIARHLCISVRTVEAHVANMLGKTGTKSRAGLVALGYSAGLLLPGTLPPAWSGTCCLPRVAMRGVA
jgi:DNA-binding CsgD family transcriptional regulator